MPEAEHITTPTSPSVVAAIPRLVTVDGDGEVIVSVRRSLAEDELLLACQAVMVRSEAMRLLMQAVADLSPTDPRHAASCAVVDKLRPDWLVQLGRVSEIPAQGVRGLTAKAALVASLVTDDETDLIDGPPALRLAASLADDLLVLGIG